MKLLKVCFDHLTMFEDGLFDIDLFASDRVTALSMSRLSNWRTIST